MNLFYYDQTDLLQNFKAGNLYLSLSGDEASHLNVLRIKPGAEILVTDGLGTICKAAVEVATAKVNTLRILDLYSQIRSDHPVHIVIAPPKNIARFEWFLEKSTEIGIDEITPIITEHSERVNLRLDRLNKILISAMKQSLKPFIPKLNEPLSYSKFLANHVTSENSFIAWLDRKGEQHHLKSLCKLNEPVTVLIGPEGDFSDMEVESAVARGFRIVSLGKSRLRTETAALAACFTANLINEQDMSGYPLTIE